jgi:hypothetical protein
MELSNPFSEETRLLFLYVYACFLCGRSDRGLELHHIIGRNSNSPFNACPLCHECHEHIEHTPEREAQLFKLTVDFLAVNQYKPQNADWQFLINYPYLMNGGQAIK